MDTSTRKTTTRVNPNPKKDSLLKSKRKIEIDPYP